MSLAELQEELEGHITRFRTELAHVVSWQKFERAGAVALELEEELQALGLPLAPLEAFTKGVLGIATAVHDHLTAGAAEAERADLEAQLADIQAKLGAAPAAPVPAATFQEPAAGAGKGGAADGGKTG